MAEKKSSKLHSLFDLLSLVRVKPDQYIYAVAGGKDRDNGGVYWKICDGKEVKEELKYIFDQQPDILVFKAAERALYIQNYDDLTVYQTFFPVTHQLLKWAVRKFKVTIEGMEEAKSTQATVDDEATVDDKGKQRKKEAVCDSNEDDDDDDQQDSE